MLKRTRSEQEKVSPEIVVNVSILQNLSSNAQNVPQV